MFDKYKKRFRDRRTDARTRRKIAVEAARRLYAVLGPLEPGSPLREATEAEYYAAKRRAAAVLGQAVRPGDLPSDSEVREEVLALARAARDPSTQLGPEPEGEVARLADHVDRFAIYKLRLEPLETVKQDPRRHPEGDVLYHSVQVFERAREARPYDEDFLLAALLHDVGKAIDPRNHVAAGLEALRGAISKRTAWLIQHHPDTYAYRDRTLTPKARRALESSEFFEDLLLLRELDDAGRVPGVHVGTIDEALAYIRGLEDEAYLDDGLSGTEPLPDQDATVSD
jgi:predicted HD phosphohydrolase